MSDNDLIRRGDALYAIAGWEIPSTAIAALPAVTVGVRPLVWHEGDEPEEWKSGPYNVWCELGKFQLYHWSIVMGEPHETAEAAKAAAQADYEARILAALDLTPAPDLSDPVTVHANMLRGSIAKPTVEQIVHLYGREAFQPMIDVAITKALEKACLAVSEHADWPEDEHGRTEQVDLFARVINAIREITPAVTPAPDAAAIREAYDAVGRIVASHERKEDFRAAEIAGQCHDAILALIQKGGA